MKKILLALLSVLIICGCNSLQPRIIDKEYGLKEVKLIENSFPILEKFEIKSFESK